MLGDSRRGRSGAMAHAFLVKDLRKVTEDEDADRGRLLGFPRPNR